MTAQFRIGVDDLRKHERWLRKLALDLARDPELANDLVQDTMVVALRKPPPDATAVRPWLAAVLRNAFRMWLRTHGRRERREAHAEQPPPAQTPERALDFAWASQALVQEIDRLSEPFRTTVLMRYYEGLRASEIANRLGIPAATVRKRQQLALAELRKRLDRRTDGDRDAWKGSIVRGFGLAVPGAIARRLRRHAPSLALAGGGALLLAVGSGAIPRVQLASQAAAVTIPRDRVAPPFLSSRAAAESIEDSALPPSATGTVAASEESSASDETDEGAVRDPCRPLRELIEAAPAGATVNVPACTYREHVVVWKPLTLVAAPGAEIRGSDLWPASGFTRNTHGWVSAAAVPPFVDPARQCDHQPGACVGPEQVFVDGKRLTRVGRGSRPAAGEFALDDDRRVVLGDDPAGHVVEVTVRPGWMSVVASDVTVRGFRMRHAAGHEHTFSVVNPARRVRIERNVLTDAWTFALTVAGSDHVVEGNEITDSGGGLRIEPGSGTVARGNKIHGCDRVDSRNRSWRSPALSVLIADDVTLEGNEIVDNRGLGIHVLRSKRLRIEGNVVRDNDNAAVALQDVVGAQIKRNRLWSNGHRAVPHEPGIFVVSSRGVDVADNAIAFHPFALYVGPKRRSSLPAGFDTCQDTAEVRIHDNLVVAPNAGGIHLSGDPREQNDIAPCASVRAERNAIAGRQASVGDVALSPSEATRRLATAGVPIR